MARSRDPLRPRGFLRLVRDNGRSATKAAAVGGELVDLDRAELVRLHTYQETVDRASALLCRLQPDLIAAEVVPIRDAEPARSRWPFLLAAGLSTLFWLSIGWAVSAAVLSAAPPG